MIPTEIGLLTGLEREFHSSHYTVMPVASGIAKNVHSRLSDFFAYQPFH
jgi:hypothetical protein